MSVTVHDVAAARRRSPHQRMVLAATVVATLGVIALPAGMAGSGPAGRTIAVDIGPAPTPAARRVLKEVPGAFETRGLVVVPAATDPETRWTGALSSDLVVGPVVALGVRGLAEPGYLPSTARVPAWLRRLGTKDQVYDDVGDLSFACTRWPGVADCTGTLLLGHAGRHYIFRSGLHFWRAPGEATTLLVLDDGVPRNLVIGGAPPGTARVLVALPGSREVEARTSAPGPVHGVTVWWVAVAEPLSAVTFLDRDGAVLARSSLGR